MTEEEFDRHFARCWARVDSDGVFGIRRDQGGSPDIPNAICAYPIPNWRLDHVQWDQREGQPDGWIVSLKREHPNWAEHRREYVAMARSDIGPLEAWDEAIQIALRSEARYAQGSEAKGLDTKCESPVPEGQAPTPSIGSTQGDRDG